MEKHPARKGGGEAGAGERRNRDAINYFMLQKPEQVHVMWAPYGSSDLTFTVARHPRAKCESCRVLRGSCSTQTKKKLLVH